MTTIDTTGGAGADEAARRDALADRLFMSLIEANELAERGGIDARYAREWLEQQAVRPSWGRPARAATSSPSSSRRCTTWPARPRPSGPSGRCWPTAGWWSWPTRRSPRPSPPPATVREWSGQAGFASFRELPVDHAFWRFYELSG